MIQDAIARQLEDDLRACAREPIHLSGAIQPQGWLLVASMPDWTLRHASANVEALFGVPLASMIGVSLQQWLSSEVLHALGNALTGGGGEQAGQQRAAQAEIGRDGRLCDFSVHRMGAHLHIEIEPAEPAQRTQSPLVLAQAMIARLAGTRSLDEFHARAAQQMRALSGFDRVMIYKFLDDGSGKVIAESRRATLSPYLGLHFPASDIPAQARELYRRNRIRLIPDAGYAPVPILPLHDDQGRPLDLGFTALRSVSPVHLEYLRNMQVTASMSVSVLCDGRLWGLVACHHASARPLPMDMRAAADLFGMFYSMQVASRERAEEFDYESRARIVHDETVAGLATAADPFALLVERLPALPHLIPCDGAGLWRDGRWQGEGTTPPAEVVAGIIKALSAQVGQDVARTEAMADLAPDAAAASPGISGVLAIQVSPDRGAYLLLFRRELVEVVQWAGDPGQAYTRDGQGRLSPRASFDAWQQTVRGRSAPWTPAECRIAERLRATLLGLQMQRMEDGSLRRDAAGESQKLVIAELNHRIKNMLALMQSMVMQSAEDTDDIREFVDILEGRIRALAFAHDQFDARAQIGGLRELVDAELRPYHGREGRFRIDGPPVLLAAKARSALALVLHEMATNAAKAGSLSVPAGRLEVSWHLDGDGACRILWRERGGPQVVAPSREGFGSTLIRRAIPHELGGGAEVRYPAAGVEADFTIPAQHIHEAPHPPADPQAVPAVDTRVVEGLSLLVLEDNMLIALDTEHLLRRMGARQVEIAGSVEEAMRVLDGGGIQAAVVDVHLGEGGSSLPVADRLAREGTPFAFATGYRDSMMIPEPHRRVPVVRKPGTLEKLAAALGELLPRTGGAGREPDRR